MHKKVLKERKQTITQILLEINNTDINWIGDIFLYRYWRKDEQIRVVKSLAVVSNSLQPQGILQARILEWVAVPFSSGSSQPRDWTHISWIAGGFFTSLTTREVYILYFIDFLKFNIDFLRFKSERQLLTYWYV